MNPLRLAAARRINLGKRAGVASGLLGVLCILAELCFLLPDLLVTHFFFSHAFVQLLSFARMIPAQAAYWHPTSDEEGLDKNFAGFLPVWDVIFGTAHQPAHWPKNYGTVKFQPPETWMGQLMYPFRRRGEQTPYA